MNKKLLIVLFCMVLLFLTGCNHSVISNDNNIKTEEKNENDYDTDLLL